MKDIPGGKITIAKEEEGPPTGAPINLEISGPDFEILGKIAKQVRDALNQIPYVEDVRDDYVEGIPSVQVNVDRQKAALFGLTTDMIGFALKSAYNGLNVSSFRQGDDDFDITLQLKEADRRVVDVLHELLLPTPSGETVPLSTVASVTFAGTIGNINRINNERVVTVKANIEETKTTGPVVRQEAAKFMDKVVLPAGYSMKFTGEQDEQKESEDFLSKAFLVALLLIFLVLVAMFNSVSQPFIIMTSVILSLGGAFLGMALFQSPFGIIMTGVGVISLAGVVVNNAIVLLDYTNKLRERGHALKGGGGLGRCHPTAAGAAHRHHHDPWPDPDGYRYFLRFSHLVHGLGQRVEHVVEVDGQRGDLRPLRRHLPDPDRRTDHLLSFGPLRRQPAVCRAADQVPVLEAIRPAGR